MSKRLSKFLQLGIIGLWLILLSVLVYRHYFSGAEYTPLQALSETQFKTDEEWLGIYAGKRKIGYLKTSSEKIGSEYRFTQYAEIESSKSGKRILNVTRLTCLTDRSYRLKSYEYESRAGETVYKASGEMDEDNMLLVFFDTAGKKETQARQLKGRPYMTAAIKHMISEQGMEKGKRLKVPVLNIFSLGVDEVIVEVQELIPVKVGINVSTAYKLKIGQTLSWVSDGGNTMKEQHPQGLLYLAETEDMAMSKDDITMFDFLSLPSFKASRQLSKPEDLTRLKVKIEGIDVSGYPLLDGGRQVFREGVVEISKKYTADLMKKRTYRLPYHKKDFEMFLSATPYVQSDHHTVQYNADQFVDIEKNDAFRLARFLTSNLYMTISKSPQTRLVKSLDVFKTHEGECNEHTIMFTSFARAGGLPTRMVGGMVYLKGHFYYHTWPEVWFDGWVPVDPSMAQFPADVTHIRIMEGDIDKLASVGEIIKNIKIDIVEAL